MAEPRQSAEQELEALLISGKTLRELTPQRLLELRDSTQITNIYYSDLVAECSRRLRGNP